MYVTPFVDRVIKPSKPLSNFAVDVQGTQATFQNRSSGGSEGWWDFGDGSALEPFNPNQPAVTHTYARPGSYTAKLAVHSLFGEESERTANVQVDGPAGGPPEITSFEVASMRPDRYAPATFRVLSKVKNEVDLCIWSAGGEMPLEVQTGAPNEEKVFTFQQPGDHTIKLAVVQGKNVVQKSATVHVEAARPGVAMAMLKVTNQVIHVQSFERRQNVKIAFPDKHAENVYAFAVDVPAERGCRITLAQVTPQSGDTPVQDAKLALAPDGSKVTLTGKLVKAGGLLKRNAPPVWVPEVVLKEERRGAPEAAPPMTMANQLQLPGAVTVNLPPLRKGLLLQKRTLGLDLFDGTRSTTVPPGGVVSLQGRLWRVSAADVGGDRVQIKVDPAEGKPPFGN
jgi:hypothetical protein